MPELRHHTAVAYAFGLPSHRAAALELFLAIPMQVSPKLRAPRLFSDPLRNSLGLLFLAVSMWLGSAARADDLEVRGFLALRGVSVSSQPSWREGAFGRFTLGAEDTDDDASHVLGQLHVTLNWQPSPFFGSFVHVVGQAEPSAVDGRELGVIEAFLHGSVPVGDSDAVAFQLGHFILPTSRENTEVAWSSPYTLTFSALNTWIGEEMRLTGLSTEYQKVLGGRDEIRIGGSVFGGNDSNGALLAWRGWALGDRLTAFGEVVPLPPIGSLQPGGPFELQRNDGTKPYGEDLDDRAGWAGYLRWRHSDRAVLQVTRLDNRGDRELHAGEYAWRTEMDILGGELRLGDDVVLVAELFEGSTGMGDPAGFNVQADLEAAYFLASWSSRQFRTTLRYETFETVDVDRSGADNNNEDGEAWTLAFFWEPRHDLRLGLELLDLEADRPAAREIGFDDDTGGQQVQLELRYYFDW